MSFSSLHPIAYRLSVFAHRALRWSGSLLCRFAKKKSWDDLPKRIAHHQSILLRKLGNVDMRLQYNKVTNLRIAAHAIDGVLILPGETFSFWRLVGNPTVGSGYVSGMLLSNGRATEGIGGGLCQLANLLYWMALHTDLVVTERHHHSVDVFPDSGRTVPFGTGAAVFYNYVDLQFTNPTKVTFQIRVSVTDEHLKGEIRASEESPLSYSIAECDHRFVQEADGVYRENSIVRTAFSKRTGNCVEKRLLYRNHSKVLYDVDPAQLSPTV